MNSELKGIKLNINLNDLKSDYYLMKSYLYLLMILKYLKDFSCLFLLLNL